MTKAEIQSIRLLARQLEIKTIEGLCDEIERLRGWLEYVCRFKSDCDLKHALAGEPVPGTETEPKPRPTKGLCGD